MTSREQDSPLDEILAAYLDRPEPVSAATRQDLLARHPEWATQLADFFADQDRFAAFLKPLTAAPSTLPELESAAAGAEGAAAAGERFGAYELVEEIGRGGMGVVFKARQTDLQRVVALKMILSGKLASPAEVQRFRLEAEAVARLDHPHIVPVYEVGAHAGSHFYSMKFVEGSNLAHWQLRRPLTHGDQRRVAQLLGAVALAVQHAHERGVLHRDLKPANILLDVDGQPHVTDFGLAKRLAPSLAEQGKPDDLPNDRGRRHLSTPSGAAVGTPSYMAPEQALGPGNVTTAADIYSLGCILYELLTGRPPFRAETPFATLLDALERTPASPGELCPGLARDLEIICLKCLEKDPHRRYPSAAELAQDLGHFVAGEPIRALPVGRLERLRRWCVRQPFLAGTLAAFVLVVLAAFVLVTWQWQRAEFNFHESKYHEESARRQLQLAEERFELASALVDEFCLRLSEDRLSRLSGTQALRKDLLDSSSKYFQKFLEQKGNDPGLRRKLAKAHASLATVLSSIGARSDALKSYQSALTLYNDLLREKPADKDLAVLRAQTLHRIGMLQSEAGQWTSALDFFKQARDVFEKLATRSPGDAGLQADLAAVLANMGNVYRLKGDLAGALPYLEQGLTIRKKMAAREPKNVRFQAMLATMYLNYGNLIGSLGKDRECLECYEQARQLHENAVRAAPRDAERQRALALVLRVIGEHERLAGDKDKAAKILHDVQGRLERLIQENPDVVQLYRDLAATYRQIGHLHSRTARKEEALIWYRRGRDTMARALRLQPDLPENWNDLAKCWYDMGAMYSLGQKRYADSLNAYEEACALREKVVKAAPDHPGYRHDLALTHGNRAVALFNLGRTGEALAAVERAVNEDRRLLTLAPQIANFRRTCSGHYDLLTDLQWRAGHHGEALASARARAELWPKSAKELYASARDLGRIALSGKQSKATAADRTRAEDLVIDLLRQAISAGFRDRQALVSETAFASLQVRRDFQDILASLKGDS